MSLTHRKNRTALVATALLTLCALPAAAQQGTTRSKDTVIAPATLEVIQLYKPEVRLPVKETLRPSLPPVDTSAPNLRLDVPVQTLSLTYHAIPIRPLALTSTDTVDAATESFVQVGLGNFSTIAVDAGYTSRANSYYRTTASLHHLSQQSTKLTGQQSALTSLSAATAWDGGLARFQISGDAFRNQYRYYGYDRLNYDLDVDTMRQTFYGVTAGGVVTLPASGKTADWQAAPSAYVSYYGDVRGAAEPGLAVDAPASKGLGGGYTVYTGLSARLARFSNADVDQWNNVAMLWAGLGYQDGGFHAMARLAPTLSMNGVGSLLPAAEVGYTGGKANILLGYDAAIVQNTYQQLSTRNPYMLNSYLIRQTCSDEVFLKVGAALRPHLGIHARLSWNSYHNLPLFINNPTGPAQNFLVVYDDIMALKLEAGASYVVGKALSLEATVVLNGWFNQETYSRPWHEPATALRAGAGWKTPLKGLTISGYLQTLGGMFARNPYSGMSVKLDPVVDFGLGADYQAIPRLGVFLKTANLLNAQNERWLNYPSYGAQVQGGLRYSFQ